MHAFGLLAEAKMMQWEQDKKNGEVSKRSSAQVCSSDSSDSLEKQLYAGIEKLIQESANVSPAQRADKLRQAEKMQVQLMCRLEKSGYNHLVKLFADNILELKRNVAKH